MGYVTGKMIKELRERKHLTQRQLAEMCQFVIFVSSRILYSLLLL